MIVYTIIGVFPRHCTNGLHFSMGINVDPNVKYAKTYLIDVGIVGDGLVLYWSNYLNQVANLDSKVKRLWIHKQENSSIIFGKGKSPKRGDWNFFFREVEEEENVGAEDYTSESEDQRCPLSRRSQDKQEMSEDNIIVDEKGHQMKWTGSHRGFRVITTHCSDWENFVAARSNPKYGSFQTWVHQRRSLKGRWIYRVRACSRPKNDTTSIVESAWGSIPRFGRRVMHNLD